MCLLQNVRKQNEKSYLSKNGIAIIGHHDASHGVQKHLGPKQRLYLSVPENRKGKPVAEVSVWDKPTFIIDFGPKHVRMISAIVYWKELDDVKKIQNMLSTNQRMVIVCFRGRGMRNSQSQCFNKVTFKVGLATNFQYRVSYG